MKKLAGSNYSLVRFSEKKQLRTYDSTYKRYTRSFSSVRFSEKKKMDKTYLSYVVFGWPVKKKFPRAFSAVSFSDSSLAVQTYYNNGVLTKRAAIPPSFEEKTVIPASMAFIQLPDAGLSIRIPAQNFGGGKLYRARNQGLSWDMRLLNLGGEFTCKSESWKALLEPGFYSNEYQSRKFVCLVFSRTVSGVTSYEIFPRLVIRDLAGDSILERGGIDEITFLLGQTKNFNSYVARETLVRLSDRVYESLVLTLNEKSNLTEIRVDDILRTATLNTSNRRWTFNSDIDSHSLVQVTNPLDAAWVINDICKKVVDSQATKIRKEYFNIIHKFPAFKIYNTIQCQGKEMISIIKYILQAIGGEYKINPIITNTYPTDVTDLKLSMETLQTKLPSEYNTFGKFYTPESIMARKLSISSSGVNKKNVVKVKSPSQILNTQVKITSTIYNEVQKEIPLEPVPSMAPAGQVQGSPRGFYDWGTQTFIVDNSYR